MTSRNRLWSLVASLVTVALVVGACQQAPSGTTTPTASAAPAEEKDLNATITVNLGTEPLRPDPQAGSFTNEIAVSAMVFEGLLTLDPKTSQPIPAQADLPTISSDGKVYTFKIKDGMKYSDGVPVTAKNFVYAIKRGCDPRLESEYSFVLFDIVGCEAFNSADLKTATPAQLTDLASKIDVKATDDKTLVITLTQAAGYFSSIMTLWQIYPVREDMVTKGGDKWTEPATFIGNGPFVLKEWKHNEKLVLVRNDNYRKKVQFKTLVYQIISEAAVELAAYRNNELDLAGVGASDLRTVSADPDLSKQLNDRDGSCTYYFGMNVRRPPFDDAKIRLAFAKSFDRDDFIKNIRQGIGKAATGFIMPGVPGNDPADDVQKFDVAAAKALLAAASPASVAGLSTLKYTFSSTTTNKTIGEWATNQWKTNLGVKDIALDPVASTAYTALFRQGKESPQLFFLGWCWDFPDPQNQLTTVWKTGNFSAGRTGWSNAEFDKLVDQGDRESDQAKRVAIYKQAGLVISKDAPAAWVQYSASKTLVKPWLKGLVFNAGDRGIPGFFSIDTIYILKH